MPDTYDEFVFPEPWWDLRGAGYKKGAQREELVRRLLVEIHSDHALARRSVEAVAAFTRQDEILHRLDGGQGFLIAQVPVPGTRTAADITARERALCAHVEIGHSPVSAPNASVTSKVSMYSRTSWTDAPWNRKIQQ